MSRDAAETVAIGCLGWLVGKEDLLPVFLGSTGAGEDDLRARAQDPDFLGSVLDFILMDDAWVIEASEGIGTSPDRILQARASLPGGEQVHWT